MPIITIINIKININKGLEILTKLLGSSLENIQ